MKKNIWVTVLIIPVLLSGCSSSSKLKENRNMLKEYAYCKCLEYAIKDTALFNNDVSISIYVEIDGYYFTAFQKADSLAKQVASEIKPLIVADYENKKSSFYDCFQFYKSKRLDSLVKTLDKEQDKTTWGNK